MKPPQASDAGFSLFETLVALAVLAVVLGTMLSAFGSGLARSASAKDRLDAVLFARSMLEEVLYDPDLGAFPLSGTYRETWAWRADLVPRLPVVATRYDERLVFYDVVLTVGTPEGRSLASLTSTLLRRR